jgi:hypothetical protein
LPVGSQRLCKEQVLFENLPRDCPVTLDRGKTTNPRKPLVVYLVKGQNGQETSHQIEEGKSKNVTAVGVRVRAMKKLTDAAFSTLAIGAVTIDASCKQEPEPRG